MNGVLGVFHSDLLDVVIRIYVVLVTVALPHTQELHWQLFDQSSVNFLLLAYPFRVRSFIVTKFKLETSDELPI